jgi:hypothetical protein
MFYTRSEREQIVSTMFNKIYNYTRRNGMFIVCDNDEFSFIKQLKDICNKYIEMNDNNIEYGGVIYFTEINKKIHYILPANKTYPLLFNIM